MMKPLFLTFLIDSQLVKIQTPPRKFNKESLKMRVKGRHLLFQWTMLNFRFVYLKGQNNHRKLHLSIENHLGCSGYIRDFTTQIWGNIS